MRISDWSSDVCSSDLDGDPDRTGERSRDRGSRGVSEPGRLQRGSPLGRSGQPPGSGTGADRATGRRTLHGAGGIGRKEHAGGGRAVVGIARLIPCRSEPRPGPRAGARPPHGPPPPRPPPTPSPPPPPPPPPPP